MSPSRKIDPTKKDDGVDEGNGERVPMGLKAQDH